MKTEEDEAFDEIARKQGHWGGGFMAKRAMAMDKINSEFDEEYKKSHAELAKYCTEAQPAQEPVAWAVQGCSKMWRGEFAEIDAKAEAKRIGGTCVAYALYTQSLQREWVGLTDDELADLWYKESLDWIEFARAHEAALKEKNFD